MAELHLKLSSGVHLCLRHKSDFPVLQEIFIDRQYDPLLRRLPEIRRWVDLGANAGLFSLYLEHWAREREWTGPRRALLVDPHREALATARRSLAESGLAFEVVEGAVGAGRAGSVSFYEAKTAYRASTFAPDAREGARPVELIDLERSGSSLAGAPELVKVDIEGAEKPLFDFWETWLRQAKYLMIEWHEPHMSGRQLDERCARLGFVRVAVERLGCYAGDPRPNLELPVGFGLWQKAAEAAPRQN